MNSFQNPGFFNSAIDSASKGYNWMADTASTAWDKTKEKASASGDYLKKRASGIMEGDFSGDIQYQTDPNRDVDDYDLAALADAEDAYGGAEMAKFGTGQEALQRQDVGTEAIEMRNAKALEEGTNWKDVGNVVADALKKMEDKREGIKVQPHRPGFAKIRDTGLQASLVNDWGKQQIQQSNMLATTPQNPQIQQLLKQLS